MVQPLLHRVPQEADQQEGGGHGRSGGEQGDGHFQPVRPVGPPVAPPADGQVGGGQHAGKDDGEIDGAGLEDHQVVALGVEHAAARHGVQGQAGQQEQCGEGEEQDIGGEGAAVGEAGHGLVLPPGGGELPGGQEQEHRPRDAQQGGGPGGQPGEEGALAEAVAGEGVLDHKGQHRQQPGQHGAAGGLLPHAVHQEGIEGLLGDADGFGGFGVGPGLALPCHQLVGGDAQNGAQGGEQGDLGVALAPLPFADRLVADAQQRGQLFLGHALLPAEGGDKTAGSDAVHMRHLLFSAFSIAEPERFGNRFLVGDGKPAVESQCFQGFAGSRGSGKREKRKNNVLLKDSLNLF